MKYHTDVTDELPVIGELKKDRYGNYYCHICGKSFKKLMSHVVQKHNMTAMEYKRHFGLYTTKGILCEDSRRLARERNLENYGIVVEENLVDKGKNTRFKHGAEGRPKSKVCPQLMNRLKQPSFIKRGE